MAEIISPDEALSQFLDAARVAGLKIQGQPIADGKVHRVPVKGTTKKSGGYVLHMDERPAGQIWNYKSGYKSGWSASGATTPLTAEERKERDARIERERETELREKLEREHGISRWATTGYTHATVVDTHPYLTSKGVDLPGYCRVDGDSRLLIPMHDIDGKIWNVQRITDGGEKRYVSGGRKAGMHNLLGNFDPSKNPLTLAEGLATGCTVHDATGQAVAVCFDSSNLLPVAKAYRERYPDLRIIVAADNDHHLPKQQTAAGRVLTNVGMEKANIVAAEVGAAVLAPDFPEGHPGTDWNDYAAEYGIQAVREKFAVQQDLDQRLSEITLMNEARPSQVEAIERVNALGGDLKHSQQLLTLSFESMKARGVESLSECWERAADITVEKLESERSESTERERDAANMQAQDLEKDQQALYETWPARHEQLGSPPRDQEKLTRTQVAAILNEGGSLRDKDMSGLDLSDFTFHGQDLSGSNLSGTLNRGTVYRKCYAIHADFSAAQFENAVISENVAGASIWNDAKMSNSVFADNMLKASEMRNILVIGKEIAREMPRPLPEQSRMPRIDGITLLESIRDDASRLSSFAQRSARKVRRMFSGPSEQEKRIYDMALFALKSCGWDGDNHSATLSRAFHDVQDSFHRLAESGQFTKEQVDGKIDIYRRIVEEQNEKRAEMRKRIPEVSGNDFRGADMTGSRIIGVDVKGNDFQGAILRDFIVDGLNANNQFHDLATHLEKDQEREPGRDVAPLAERKEQQTAKRTLRNENGRNSRSR